MNQVVNRVRGAVALATTLMCTTGAAAGGASSGAGTQDRQLGPDVVSTRVDEATARNPARQLLEARLSESSGGATIDLITDGELGTFEVIELENPPRLAVDLHGVERALARPLRSSGGAVEGLRYGVHDGKVRVVLDASPTSPLPSYELIRQAKGLRISLVPSPEAKRAQLAARPRAAAAAVATAPREARPAAAVEPPRKVAPAKARVQVLDLAFQGEGAAQRVEIDLSNTGTYDVARPDPRTLVLTLRGASLPKKLTRSLDTSAFSGPVRTVSSFADSSSGDVQVVVALAKPASDEISAEGKRLVWSFRGEAIAEGEIIDEAKGVVRIAPDEDEDLQMSPRRSRPVYSGRRVSFEFKDIDIHNLLRVIAEVSKRNIVVADDVRGSITIRLRNVPWDQALDLILKTKGLGKEVTGNIIRIAPLKQIQAEQEQAAKAALAREEAMPLRVRIIPVNYALANDVESKVKDLLTKRGSVTVDQRTNTLIVKDISEAIGRAEALVRSLDTQTPQVLIAARIVETSTNFKRDIGIQWGGNLSANASMGNSTGLGFPSNISSAGSIPGTVGAGGSIPSQPQWAVSFPAAVADSSGGAMGFSFGSAGGAALLNLRLTALETQGLLKTVSAPKVTTLDNKEAIIGQGISIPFSQVSAAGVNTVFVEAKLELRVTPHVTSDGSILMKIRASNNQPSENITGANGQPAITKREAETEVLVKDGDTTVIGGIYTRRTSENVAQVPLFGDIPILGWLFKSRTNADERTELLIFISPTIVNREASVIAGG